jgi:hypothetical protein
MTASRRRSERSFFAEVPEQREELAEFVLSIGRMNGLGPIFICGRQAYG